MSKFQRFVVAFDDGSEVEVQSSSRDLLALEKAGVDLQSLSPIAGSYAIAHATLQRYKRRGLTDIDVPDTADELADIADLVPVDDDPEGKGSGQGRPTG